MEASLPADANEEIKNFAFPKRIATPLLLLACLAGIFAAITGEAFIALAPLAASAGAILALSARRWRFHPYAPAQACVSAVAFLATILALSPLWMTALMFRPRIAGELRDIIQSKIMHEVAKMMFAKSKEKVLRA